VALSPYDARAYSVQRIHVFAPQMPPQPEPAPWWAHIITQDPHQWTQSGRMLDFGKALLDRVYLWD